MPLISEGLTWSRARHNLFDFFLVKGKYVNDSAIVPHGPR